MKKTDNVLSISARSNSHHAQQPNGGIPAAIPPGECEPKSVVARTREAVPLPFARGLSRTQAAAYVGVSPSLFDQMVYDGRMPGPKRINSRTVWDRQRLDEAFSALPDEHACNPWDAAAA